MKMKSWQQYFLAGSAFCLLASCGSPFPQESSSKEIPSENSSMSETPSSSVESSDTSFDFGDPESWPADTTKVRDLGDAILNPYPYDTRYDWGQSILFDEEDQIYKMWWCRQSPYDTIWYAESKDLKHWNNCQKIMIVEQDSTWIKMHVGKPSVLKIDGKYRMYLEAPCTIQGWKEFNNNVLMAESDDGIHFTFYTGNTDEPYPVIRMSDEQIAASCDYAANGSSSGYGYYGIGQPSAVYKDGTYYLYVTYSLEQGDRFYCYTSKDGVHFGDGTQVFVRAGSGVKYNDLTQKFMMTYTYTSDGQSRVYYMDSEDGFHFTYNDYASASVNKNILARGSGLVRNYPDFICNEQGHVTTHTVYVSYMEGKMAEDGQDWRLYSSTWDVHIAMFNPPEFANRTMVLPNGEISSSDALKTYSDKNVPYDDYLLTASLSDASISIDGVEDNGYVDALSTEITRQSYAENAVPSSLTGTMKLLPSAGALNVFIQTENEAPASDDKIVFLLDEDRLGSPIRLVATLDGVTALDEEGEEVYGIQSSVVRTGKKLKLEAKIPWNKSVSGEKCIGVDCYLYGKADSVMFKNLTTWNDCLASYDASSFGEVIIQ